MSAADGFVAITPPKKMEEYYRLGRCRQTASHRWSTRNRRRWKLPEDALRAMDKRVCFVGFIERGALRLVYRPEELGTERSAFRMRPADVA